MLCTGGLALFCAVSFPLLAFAETAVPRPGESLEGSKLPKQSVSLENVDKGAGRQGAESVRFTLTDIRVEHEGIKVKDEDIAKITDKATTVKYALIVISLWRKTEKWKQKNLKFLLVS